MGLILSRVSAFLQTSDTCTNLQEDSEDPFTEEEFFDALDTYDNSLLLESAAHLSAEHCDVSTGELLSSTPTRGQQLRWTSWPNLSQIHVAGQVSEDSGLGSFSGLNGGRLENTATQEEKSKTQECQTEQDLLDERDATIKQYKHDFCEAKNAISELRKQDSQRKELLKWTEGRLLATEIEKRKWDAEKIQVQRCQEERQLVQEQEHEKHEAIIKQLRRDLQKARGEISAIDNELTERTRWSEAKLAAFDDEKSKLEKDNAQYRERHSQQASLLQDKEAAASKLEQELQAARATISGFERHSAYTKWLEEKLDILEEEKLIGDQHNVTCKAEEHKQLKKKLEEKSAAVKQLLRQLQQVQRENKELTACLEQRMTTRVLDGNLADAKCTPSLESRLVTLLREKEVKEAEMDCLRREVGMLRETNEELRSQVAVLEAKRRVAQESVRALGQQKVAFQLQVTKARVAGEELRRQLDTKSTHVKELSGQVQKLGQDFKLRSSRVQGLYLRNI